MAVRYILVVDDDTSANEIISRNLEKAVYRVISTFSGREALKDAKILNPDMILLDLNLPDIDGETAYSELKSSSGTSGIPILIISGENPSRVRNMQETGKLDSNDFFVKPVDYDALIERIEEYFPEQKDSSRKRVLVAEDDPSANEILVKNLQKEGYRTISVFSGEDAIRFAKDEVPDLVLLDVNLPAERGELVYTMLKSMQKTQDIPVIIVSGVDPARIRKMHSGKKIDIKDIFLKPVDYEKLLDRIAAVLK